MNLNKSYYNTCEKREKLIEELRRKRPVCRVKSCINSNIETKNEKDKIFHFPRGQGQTREAALEWLRFTNEFAEMERFLTTGHYGSRMRNYGICQRHFAPHQFVKPNEMRLNRGAIPLIHDPDDAAAAATHFMSPRCKNDNQLTIESRGGSTSSEKQNTVGTGRENQIRLLKEEIKALIEIDNSPLNFSSQPVTRVNNSQLNFSSQHVSRVDNSQLNWSSQDITHVVDDTLLDPDYLCLSSGANTLANAEKETEKRGIEEVGAMFDVQEVRERIQKDTSLPKKQQIIKGNYPEGKIYDESHEVILPVKNYSKRQNGSTGLPSDYEDELQLICENNMKVESSEVPSENQKMESSEFPCGNNQEMISSQLALSTVKWEVLPEEMCRLCASKDEYMKQPIDMWMKIMKQLIPKMVAMNDGLPQYICRPCAEKLCTCIAIKQGFIESYKKLKSEFAANVENIEPELMSDFADNGNVSGSDLEDDSRDPTLCNTVDDSTFDKNKANGDFEEVATNIKPTGKKRKKRKLKKYSFICMECEKLFYSSKTLKEHMKREHDTSKCEYCNKYFSDSAELEAHVKTHGTGTYFKCHQCGMQMESIKLLKEHLINHRPPKYKCFACCKSFRNFFEMKHHEKLHKKSICEICGKQMKSDSYLRVHMRMHTGEKPYQCEVCGLSFSTSDRYYTHKYKKHSSEQFHCEICGKILYTAFSFERHKLGHEKGKQFKCDVCLLDFTYRFSKEIHQKAKCSTSHCVVCSLVFPDVHELIQHRSKEHLEEEVTSAAFVYRSQRTYDCTECSKCYKKSDSLLTHIEKHHRKQKKSPSKLSPKKKKSVQKKPVKKESVEKKPRKLWSCTKCERKFKTRRGLLLHTTSHNEEVEHRNFSCSYCKEEFEELNALIDHESQHLKEKVFSCCGWIFCSKADYIRHKTQHSQSISDIPYEDVNYGGTTELNIVLPSHMLT